MNAPPRSASPRLVLLVEDNPHDRELTLAAIRDLAEQIVVARDGVEALDFLLGHGRWIGQGLPRPALVLLDLKLPKLDGLEVLQFLRAHPFLRETRVVVLSSSDETSDRARCAAQGVVDYVRKGVDFSHFRCRVRRDWPRWVGTEP